MATSCFVPGCVTGYVKTRRENKLAGRRNLSLFIPPKDDHLLFEKWKIMIRRKDKILSLKDKVCELHFEEGCIETDFITKMPDGTIHKIPKKHVLVKGSVPTIFPYQTSNLPSQANKVRKGFSMKRLKKLDDNNSAKFNIGQESNDFYKLSAEVKKIATPNSLWSVAYTEDFIIFAKWNSKYCSERRVVICKDFSTKAFLMNVEITLSNEGCSIESISQLLQKVDDLKICKNADSGILSGCLGLVGNKEQEFCCNCYKHERVIKDAQRNNAEILLGKEIKIVSPAKNINKRNLYPKEKVLGLNSQFMLSKHCSFQSKEGFLEAISHLPTKQQTTIKSSHSFKTWFS